MACNRNCSCLTNKKSYSPVCGADQLSYISPCHAGCSHSVNGVRKTQQTSLSIHHSKKKPEERVKQRAFPQNLHHELLVLYTLQSYYGCGCVEKGTAEPGFCLDTCSLWIPFAVTLAITSLISTIDRPAGPVINMRFAITT